MKRIMVYVFEVIKELKGVGYFFRYKSMFFDFIMLFVKNIGMFVI